MHSASSVTYPQIIIIMSFPVRLVELRPFPFAQAVMEKSMTEVSQIIADWFGQGLPELRLTVLAFEYLLQDGLEGLDTRTGSNKQQRVGGLSVPFS